MRLTQFTDYGLRALMRLAADTERSFSSSDIAAEFGISRNHLTKVIRDLHVNDYDNPMRVQVWTNLFDSMEACCDACELAADVMNTIMLKNV